VLYILLAAALVAAVLLYMRKPAPKTTQDVIGDTEITQDGLIKSGNTYRIVIEVEPKNLDTVSETERRSVWMNFFSLINTLNIPYTLLAHSRIFEAKDYLSDFEKRLENLPDALQESGRHVIAHLQQMEDSHIRDKSGYVILKYDPVAGQTGNLNTGVGMLDRAISKSGQKKLSEKENSDLAEQMLMDAADLVCGFCEQVGMRYQRLNRVGVLNVTYQLLQRDMSPHARMVDAVESDAFSPFKRSVTREVMQHG